MAHLLVHPVSQLFYIGNQLAIALLLNAHWLYARHKGLLDSSDPGPTRSITWRIASTAAFFAASPSRCLRSQHLKKLLKTCTRRPPIYKSMATISLCMIVRNEERHLPRCLDSVRDLATETIVVDTGSTDATPRITAAAYGATVFAFDFTHPDFAAAARNHALGFTPTGRWILVVDADGETLHPTGAPAIQSLRIARDENTGYYFERHNGPTADYAVRLFPNRPEYRFRGRVHETIDASILSSRRHTAHQRRSLPRSQLLNGRGIQCANATAGTPGSCSKKLRPDPTVTTPASISSPPNTTSRKCTLKPLP